MKKKARALLEAPYNFTFLYDFPYFSSLLKQKANVNDWRDKINKHILDTFLNKKAARSVDDFSSLANNPRLSRQEASILDFIGQEAASSYKAGEAFDSTADRFLKHYQNTEAQNKGVQKLEAQNAQLKDMARQQSIDELHEMFVEPYTLSVIEGKVSDKIERLRQKNPGLNPDELRQELFKKEIQKLSNAYRKKRINLDSNVLIRSTVNSEPFNRLEKSPLELYEALGRNIGLPVDYTHASSLRANGGAIDMRQLKDAIDELRTIYGEGISFNDNKEKILQELSSIDNEKAQLLAELTMDRDKVMPSDIAELNFSPAELGRMPETLKELETMGYKPDPSFQSMKEQLSSYHKPYKGFLGKGQNFDSLAEIMKSDLGGRVDQERLDQYLKGPEKIDHLKSWLRYPEIYAQDYKKAMQMHQRQSLDFDPEALHNIFKHLPEEEEAAGIGDIMVKIAEENQLKDLQEVTDYIRTNPNEFLEAMRLEYPSHSFNSETPYSLGRKLRPSSLTGEKIFENKRALQKKRNSLGEIYDSIINHRDNDLERYLEDLEELRSVKGPDVHIYDNKNEILNEMRARLGSEHRAVKDLEYLASGREFVTPNDLGKLNLQDLELIKLPLTRRSMEIMGYRVPTTQTEALQDLMRREFGRELPEFSQRSHELNETNKALDRYQDLHLDHPMLSTGVVKEAHFNSLEPIMREELAGHGDYDYIDQALRSQEKHEHLNEFFEDPEGYIENPRGALSGEREPYFRRPVLEEIFTDFSPAEVTEIGDVLYNLAGKHDIHDISELMDYVYMNPGEFSHELKSHYPNSRLGGYSDLNIPYHFDSNRIRRQKKPLRLDQWKKIDFNNARLAPNLTEYYMSPSNLPEHIPYGQVNIKSANDARFLGDFLDDVDLYNGVENKTQTEDSFSYQDAMSQADSSPTEESLTQENRPRSLTGRYNNFLGKVLKGFSKASDLLFLIDAGKIGSENTLTYRDNIRDKGWLSGAWHGIKDAVGRVYNYAAEMYNGAAQGSLVPYVNKIFPKAPLYESEYVHPEIEGQSSGNVIKDIGSKVSEIGENTAQIFNPDQDAHFTQYTPPQQESYTGPFMGLNPSPLSSTSDSGSSAYTPIINTVQPNKAPNQPGNGGQNGTKQNSVVNIHMDAENTY